LARSGSMIMRGWMINKKKEGCPSFFGIDSQ
jgi:hypothetical protein